MNGWTRMLGFIAAIAVVGAVLLFAMRGRVSGGRDAAAALLPDPGYAARDAEVIETGYDGRERYRLTADVIRQQSAAGVIDLEGLEMDYHPGAGTEVAGEAPNAAGAERETWHLRSDQGQVRADGDDVQLSGNVRVIGPAPGSDVPLTLTTDNLRINTPTEFIETDAPVTVRWPPGNEIHAVGLEADLKAGTVRLKSNVHGSSAR